MRFVCLDGQLTNIRPLITRRPSSTPNWFPSPMTDQVFMTFFLSYFLEYTKSLQDNKLYHVIGLDKYIVCHKVLYCVGLSWQDTIFEFHRKYQYKLNICTALTCKCKILNFLRPRQRRAINPRTFWGQILNPRTVLKKFQPQTITYQPQNMKFCIFGCIFSAKNLK